MALNPVPSGSVPVPDPTKLTTDAVKALKDELIALFGKEFEFVGKEIERLRRDMDGRPAAIFEQIKHLEVLTNEKFKGVDQQFAGRDTALAAALLAQKTSVDEQNKSNAASALKSELSFDKRIEGIATLIAAQTANSDGKINDLKDRQTAMESRGKGMSDGYGWVVAGLGLVLAVAGVIIAMITKGI